MTTGFTRTPSGIVGKWHFYSMPTIWVEGPTDIYFYSPIVDDLQCRIEAFHGRDNATALIEGLRVHDFPYLVILDGDYDILSTRRSPHKRVIRLRRYSFENYLWEREPINRACHRCARSGDRTDIAGPEFDRLTTHLNDALRHLVALDVAARRSDPAPKVLPERVERLLAQPRIPAICPQQVKAITAAVAPQLAPVTVTKARADVDAFLKAHRLVDLLKGHILFGILRLLFTSITTKIKAAKVIVDDDALTQLLADAVWKRSPSPAHKALRASIRGHVKILLPLYPVAKSLNPAPAPTPSPQHDRHQPKTTGQHALENC